MGVLQACLAPTELREHLTLQADALQKGKGKDKQEKEKTKAKGKQKENGRQKEMKKSAERHPRGTSSKVSVASVDAKDIKSLSATSRKPTEPNHRSRNLLDR
eukprot:1641116-Amphidinium_carterae.1